MRAAILETYMRMPSADPSLMVFDYTISPYGVKVLPKDVWA
jgi:hypothetical protein